MRASIGFRKTIGFSKNVFFAIHLSFIFPLVSFASGVKSPVGFEKAQMKEISPELLNKIDETIWLALQKKNTKNGADLASNSIHEKLLFLTDQDETDLGVDVLVVLKTVEGIAKKFSRMQSNLVRLSHSMRVQLVVNTLVQEANDTQAGLIDFLESRGLEFRANYILNSIYIKNMSKSDLLWLASRSEVKTIIHNTPVRGMLSLNFNESTLPDQLDSSNRASSLENEDRNFLDHVFSGQIFNQIFSVRSLLGPKVQEGPLGVGPNIAFVGANQVWEKFGKKGEGIVIAGQDTGVDWDHPALVNQYRGKTAQGVDHRYSWHDSIRAPLQSGSNPCGYNSAEPCDDNKHGTHTIGTVVGDDGLGNQIGVAPGAQWIACRNMERGLGTPQTYLECYEFFLAPYPQGGNPRKDGDPSLAPHVINNSWGCPMSEGCQGKELIPVLQAIKAAGIMNVVSAGNEGSACGTVKDQPATISNYSFTVGAISDSSGNIANFSSRGPSAEDGGLAPLITAPGVNVRSSIPGGGFSGFMWSGTSMAGPHVAGAVALLWSAKPELQGSIDATIGKLTSAASPKTSTQNCGSIPGTQVPNHTYGYGNLNVLKAIEAAL